MTFEYLTPIQLERRIRELIYKPSKKFEIAFVTPYQFSEGNVIKYMIGYWFVER